jgi:hypothetical protein
LYKILKTLIARPAYCQRNSEQEDNKEMITLAGNTIRSSRAAIIDSRNIGMPVVFSRRVGILWVILLCAIVCLPASAAHAQQLTADDFSASRDIGNTWWSPQRIEPGGMMPHLRISIGDQIGLSNTKLSPSTSEAVIYRSISQPDNPIGNQSISKSRFETQRVTAGSMVEGEMLFPESFLSAVQSRYVSWESELEDSRSRTNVNGRSVYPLLQVRCAGWHLPITLYIPPLRGSDARR